MTLDSLGAVFTRYDVSSSLAAHENAAKTIEELKDEFEEQVGSSNPGLEPDDREQVKEAFQQVAHEDIQTLLDDDLKLEEFPTTTGNVAEKLTEILRSPQAEAVVDEIFSWLLATGLPPLSDEVQDDLREVVKEDIDASNQAVKDAKRAHDQLRGLLGDSQEDIDQVILEDVRSVSSVSDLESLAEELTRLKEAWVGDWNLEYSTGAGETLYRDILALLEQNLAEEVSKKNSINAIAISINQTSERWTRWLDKINSSWGNIESLAERIEAPDGSFTAEDALELVEEEVGPSNSINRYVSILEIVKEALQELDSVSISSLEQYRGPDGEVPSEIETKVSALDQEVEKAVEALDGSFAADSTSDIKDNIESVQQSTDELEEQLEELQKVVASNIETTRQLATKFDLEEEKSELNGLLNDTRSADSTAELVELFRSSKELEEEVRKPIREKLTPEQEDLFTYLLERNDQDQQAESVWDEVTQEFDRDRENLLQDIAALGEKDLVQVDIKIV